LSIDFVGTAQQAQWIEITPAPLKLGKTLCFAQCLVTSDNDLCARASATFRVVARGR
jgi:acyl-coenzyme A thioesterase PaaI-like protein